MVFALPFARFDGVRVLPFAFLAACSRRLRRAQCSAAVCQRAQRAAAAGGRAALEDAPDASRERCGASGFGWLVGSRASNPKKTRNIRILYAPELVHLRRGLRRRIEQRGRGRRRLHGRRERVKGICKVVARHVERVPQRFEDGELDGQ